MRAGYAARAVLHQTQRKCKPFTAMEGVTEELRGLLHKYHTALIDKSEDAPGLGLQVQLMIMKLKAANRQASDRRETCIKEVKVDCMRARACTYATAGLCQYGALSLPSAGCSSTDAAGRNQSGAAELPVRAALL